MLCMVVVAKDLLDPHWCRRRFVSVPCLQRSADVRVYVEEDAPSSHFPNCPSLHQLCKDAKTLSDGLRAHAAAIEFAFETSSVLGSSILHIYAQHGALADARCLLFRLAFRDKFTWNHMIKGYDLHGYAYEAFECLDHMQMEGVLPDMFIYASVLSACASLFALDKGQQIHSVIARHGFILDVVVGTALVNLYGKCGRLDNALQMFNNMHEHDTASWNAIIANHAQHEHVQDTLDLWKRMQAQGESPQKVTFISLLPALVKPSVLDHGREVHDLVTKYGFDSDLNLANALINMYGKCGSAQDGWGVFESVSEKNTLSWTVLIQSVVQNGQSDDALNLFMQMQSEGASPDTVTYVNMLCAYADLGNLAQGEMLHALLVPILAQEDVEPKNALLNLYSKCGRLDTARTIFDDMVERSVVSWNAMLSAYVQHNQGQNAIELFFHMQTSKQVPERVTFLSALSACTQKLDSQKYNYLGRGMDVHSLLVCYGVDSDTILGNALVHMYGKHRALKDAQGVFDSLYERNAVSWNVLIAERINDPGPAQAFFQMLEEGVMPCKGTFVSILTACDHSDLLKFGKVSHARMAVSRCGVDAATGNRLIDMYQRCGSIGCAQDVFHYMLERDIVTWTEMIGGYTNNGQSNCALDLFDRMQQEAISMDRVSYICILSACASGTALKKGKILHACIAGSLLEHDVAIDNALLNMYGKSGNMKEARIFFSQMPLADVVSWSSLITNYAQHGHSKDALEVFNRMQCGKVLPDQVTFVSVLSACSYAGRVAEGCYWFEFMKNDLAIEPTLDHYNCMIDLLGRAGMMTQAEDMIRDMPFEPTKVSWMTLLGACRFHVDVEQGERFAEQVFKLNPLDPAPYVMLSNIYFAAGREEQAAKIITNMREKGLGQGEFRTLLEVDGKVHEFRDDDCVHPQCEELHAEVQMLSRRLSEVDDASSKLSLSKCADIKQHFLNHGEKMALAFGLINTSPGTCLVIAKDSEVCYDCHSFMKLASKMTSREIVLKDVRRSHYMRDGTCSCGDIW